MIGLQRVEYTIGCLIAAPIALVIIVYKTIRQGPGQPHSAVAQWLNALDEIDSTAIVMRLSDGSLRVIEDPCARCE